MFNINTDYLRIFVYIYIIKHVRGKFEYQIFIKLSFWALLNFVGMFGPAKEINILR